MKIVKIDTDGYDGYALRKWNGSYFDLSSRSFWWRKSNTWFRDCVGKLETVKLAYKHLTGKAYPENIQPKLKWKWKWK